MTVNINQNDRKSPRNSSCQFIICIMSVSMILILKTQLITCEVHIPNFGFQVPMTLPDVSGGLKTY